MPRPADGLNGKAPAKSLASPRYRIGLQLSSGVPNRCAERVALANVPVAADGRLAVMLRKPTLAFYARDDRHGACGPRRPHPIPARSIRGRGGKSKNVQLKGTSLDPGQGEPQRLQLLGGALLPTPCRRRTGRHSSGTVGREVALPHAVASGQRKLKPVPTLGSRARESACRIPILHQPPQHLTVLVSRARARGVSRSLFSLARSTHPSLRRKGGVARERLVWWEPTSSGAAQLRHNGPRSADVTGSCNWTADYQTAVRSGTPRLSRFRQSPAGGDGILWVSGTYH